MSLKVKISLFFLIFLIGNGFSQNTVGLLTYDESQTSPGYNLHYPNNQGNAYLLDNCGQIVHVWEENNFTPGNGINLGEDGYLYMCKSSGRTANANISAGGAGEKLEVRDWDNNLVWEFTVNDATNRMHHDIALNPNTGGVFIVAWELITPTDAIQAGRDPSFGGGTVWPDYILEVEPDGNGGGTVVWEWHTWDHLVQDFDDTKDNFGDPAAEPGKIDINIGNPGSDWMHANSLDYNPELDQLLISVPEFHEFWIIDHNTTTAQAAGPMGDLIFRWGNPVNYGAGTADDQQLFYQHDVHWLRVEEDHPDYGKIGIFNNRTGPDFSTVHLLAPTFDESIDAYPMADNKFLPQDFDWSYIRPIPQDMWSTGLSSIQRMENGNTMIAVGRFGYAFEITPDEEIVWEYTNPMSGGQPVAQGTSLSINQNILFRLNRYPTDFPAFENRDLTPQGYIEIDPNPLSNCIISSTDNLFEEGKVNIFPNPASDKIQVEFAADLKAEQLEIFNATGHRVFKTEIFDSPIITIDSHKMPAGLYFVLINKLPSGKIMLVK